MKYSGEARFAADIVILPPGFLMDTAISLNRTHCDERIVLNKEDCLPHISLLMGCLGSAKLEKAITLLKKISSDHAIRDHFAAHILTVSTPPGDVLALDIRRNKGLQDLHESIFHAFTPLLTRDTKPEDVFGGDVKPSSLSWINDYIGQSSLENFWPHITIGYLSKNVNIDNSEPFTFMPSRLAICHLGNYCTCKKILFEVPLDGE